MLPCSVPLKVSRFLWAWQARTLSRRCALGTPSPQGLEHKCGMKWAPCSATPRRTLRH
jgi:hypothetical protein